jgi:ketosteroid isomerase-like protein
MSLDQERAAAFVDGYGATWERWDITGFVELFSEDVVYIDYQVEERVEGREALRRYIQKEEAEQGAVSVRMGRPMVDGDHVVAEFWVTGTSGEGPGTLAGCVIAQLDAADGRCTHFREYWYEVEGHPDPYNGWGE